MILVQPWEDGDWLRVILVLLPVTGVVLSGLGSVTWRIAVTSSRLLERAEWIPWRVRTLDLDAIEQVHHDIAGARLVVRGDGREIVLPDDAVTEELRQLLEGAAEASG